MSTTISQHGRISPTTQVITRALTEVGLRHRTAKRAGITQFRDFSVKKLTNKYSEAVCTYVVIYTRRGEELAAENAQQIEQATRALGYPFRVKVTTVDGQPLVRITNG